MSKMNHFKDYSDFLNEWEMRKHWLERTSLDSPLSRTSHRSSKREDGWTCDELYKVSIDNQVTGNRVSLSQFLQKSGMEERAFVDKTEKTLQMLSNSALAKKKNYAPRTHRYVCLGRIAFQVGDEFYSPILSTDYGSGDYVWGDIKDNVGATLLYLSHAKSGEEILKKAMQHKLSGTGLSDEDYKRLGLFKMENLYSETYMTVITDSADWEDAVKKQVDSGRKHVSGKKNDYEVDPQLSDWKRLLLPDAVTTFDVGSRIISSGEIKYVDSFSFEKDGSMKAFLESEPGKPKSVKTIRVGSSIEVPVPDSKKIRETGNLPEEGILVKSLTVNSFRKITTDGKTKNGIAGPITDFYVLMEDGTKIHTDLYHR